ncbi:MAG: hypothetical protein HQL79_11600 [Magnetococcales bacterium]|nr:hypothetical protein [Magnetococcales bacterium]
MTNRIVGLEIPGYPGLYAHPSPMMQKAKEAWVNAILQRLPHAVESGTAGFLETTDSE